MSEQGKCPKCGSLNLDYETIVDDGSVDEEVYYPFSCDDCGFVGQEWYHLKFDTMTDGAGEEV